MNFQNQHIFRPGLQMQSRIDAGDSSFASIFVAAFLYCLYNQIRCCGVNRMKKRIISVILSIMLQ